MMTSNVSPQRAPGAVPAAARALGALGARAGRGPQGQPRGAPAGARAAPARRAAAQAAPQVPGARARAAHLRVTAAAALCLLLDSHTPGLSARFPPTGN